MKNIVYTLLLCSTVSPVFAAPDIKIEKIWARSEGGKSAAVYFELHNPSTLDDALIGAKCDGAVETALHQTITEQGITKMIHLDRVAIPAGKNVSLAPGGIHVMMMQLENPLRAGSEVHCQLTFEVANTHDITAQVRNNKGKIH
jgi:copper(I)-binding protein